MRNWSRRRLAHTPHPPTLIKKHCSEGLTVLSPLPHPNNQYVYTSCYDDTRRSPGSEHQRKAQDSYGGGRSRAVLSPSLVTVGLKDFMRACV